jgi:ABC-type bacteriocin/lantibiotic exporter with double-glycine peptidase domain
MAGPLKLVKQRRKMDCGVATLATLTGNTYEDTNDAFVEATGKTASKGYYQADVIKAAARLGMVLVRKRKGTFDLSDTVGILGVGETNSWDHFVVLHNGTVYDAEDAAIYDVDEYLAIHGIQPWSVLIQHDPEGSDA